MTSEAPRRRATRPITTYSGSMPLLKKKLRLGAKVLPGPRAGVMSLPRLR